MDVDDVSEVRNAVGAEAGATAEVAGEDGATPAHGGRGGVPGGASGRVDGVERGMSAALSPASAAVAASVATAAALADTYVNRERRHMQREAAGEVTSHYVMNDGTPESARLLTGLKSIFARCLPNMPRQYIVRLVFDRCHRSVMMCQASGVIGGVTYRPFPTPARGSGPMLAEIAFCAVSQNLQVSGFGTRLMNWTKQYARDRDGCTHFLTYADNNAVGYFAKQGFTRTITLDREVWQGFIKDYDGGTLMECIIHPTLPHTNIPGTWEGARERGSGVVGNASAAVVSVAGKGDCGM